MTSEFEEARGWIDKSFHFEINKIVSLFEITIRVLGGSVPQSTSECRVDPDNRKKNKKKSTPA